jgi:hypothetical protein
MRIAVHFIFLAKEELIEAATLVGENQLIEPSVWTTYENDRTGLEHFQEEIERAFWTEFKANVYYENETEAQKFFRIRCISLGFLGCWHVISTKGGGPVEDLLGSARRAELFLASHSDT